MLSQGLQAIALYLQLLSALALRVSPGSVLKELALGGAADRKSVV